MELSLDSLYTFHTKFPNLEYDLSLLLITTKKEKQLLV